MKMFWLITVLNPINCRLIFWKCDVLLISNIYLEEVKNFQKYIQRGDEEDLLPIRSDLRERMLGIIPLFVYSCRVRPSRICEEGRKLPGQTQQVWRGREEALRSDPAGQGRKGGKLPGQTQQVWRGREEALKSDPVGLERKGGKMPGQTQQV